MNGRDSGRPHRGAPRCVPEPDWVRAHATARDLRRRRLHVRVALAVVLLVGLCLLAACGGDPDPTPGAPASVLQHKYHPAYTTHGSVCVSTNKYGACTLHIPTSEYHPARWSLKLYQCGHKEFKNKEHPDGCGSWWYDVSEQTYNSVNDGEQLTFK